jgi:endonuclease G
MKKLTLLLIALAISLAAAAADCPDIPLPEVSAQTEKICETAYVALFDAKLHVSRLIAYEMKRKQTLGCLPRKANFHAEGPSAKPSEYVGTGWDLGHMMSAEDASYDGMVSYESFSMLNVVPQVPGLNRQEWERLEEAVRAWAWQRGDLLVYVGPVVGDKPKTIGNHIGIPVGFFKVLVDRKSGEVLAFYIPQKAEAKGDLAPWISEVQVHEKLIDIDFGGKHRSGDALWPLDLEGWRKAHKQACAAE